MMNVIKGLFLMLMWFLKGCKMGVHIWYEAFNHKIPMWGCLVVGILSIPFNICTLLITVLINCFRHDKIDLMSEMADVEIEVEDKRLP